MNTQAASTMPKWIAMVKAGTKAIWGQVKATAKWLVMTPAGWATAATVAIAGVMAGLFKLSKAEQDASDKADELYEKSSEKVHQNEEEAKSLDELISKYKELKEKGSLDVEERNEVKEIQKDIADLVGIQANNLDLVNGKLDEELHKLEQISEEESKKAYQEAQANYYNAKDAADKAAPKDTKVFAAYYDYAGEIETEARKALEDAGFGVYSSNIHGKKSNALTSPTYGGFGQDGVMGSKMVVKAVGRNAQEKYEYLQRMIATLEQYGQSDTQIYRGLLEQAVKYEDYINEQQNAANSLIESWMTYGQATNDNLLKLKVDSVESFEQYRQQMIEEAKKDAGVGTILTDGILSEDDLETAVNNFMAGSVK